MDDRTLDRFSDLLTQVFLLSIIALLVAGVSHWINKPADHPYWQRWLTFTIAGCISLFLEHWRKKKKSTHAEKGGC